MLSFIDQVGVTAAIMMKGWKGSEGPDEDWLKASYYANLTGSLGILLAVAGAVISMSGYAMLPNCLFRAFRP